MSVNCPHCKADLGTGYTTEETVKARVAELTTKITELTPLAEKGRQLDGVQAQLGKTSSALERFKHLAGRGITSDSKVRGLSRGYDDYLAEGGKEGFGDWLQNTASKDEFYAPHFAGSSGTGGIGTSSGETKSTGTGGGGQGSESSKGTGGAGGGETKADTKGIPSTGNGTGPGASAGATKTPQQIREYFRSPEYRALPPDKQKEKRIEMETAAKRPASAAT